MVRRAPKDLAELLVYLVHKECPELLVHKGHPVQPVLLAPPVLQAQRDPKEAQDRPVRRAPKDHRV